MRHILFWIFAGAAQAVHECIHDSYIVPALRSHHAFPFRVTQAEDEHGGRRLQNANESVRADAAMRRLSAGGSELRMRVDYTYLDEGKYQCNDAHMDVQNVNRKQGGYQCDADNVVDDAMIAHIKELTEAAVRWFKRALRVMHPTRGPLSLKKYCYQFAPPPNGNKDTEYNARCWSTRTAGCAFEAPNTDFELTVTANPTQGSTLAYALTCQSDDVVGRPIAGLVNYGPARLREASPNLDNIEKSLSTAIHEIAHAMGFSSSKFEDFIDDQGRPLGKDNVLRNFESSQLGHGVSRLVTPKVVEQMKQQFACHDWPDAGGELEDYGGSGTAGSHWEKRVFRDEFMTGTDSNTPVYSAISLALFEDTGWYKADYSVAEHFHWGHRAGCNFVAHKCSTWDDRFFCDTPQKGGCSHQHFFKGYCNLASYGSNLPVQHRYIPNEHNKGGQDAHADYCPFYQGYSNADCRNVLHAGAQSASVWGETYGEESRCFDTTIMKDRYSPRPSVDAPRQACFKHTCNDGLLTIQVNDQSFACPVGGGKIDPGVADYPGEVWCPAASTLCVDAPDAVVPNPHVSPPVAPMSCASTQQLTVDDPLPLKLAKDEAACLWINLQDAIVGKLNLKVDGIKGMIYMSSASDNQQGDTVSDASGTESTDTPKLVGWPTQGASEVARHLDAGDDPMTFPKGLLESGTRLLITIVAGEASDGVLALDVTCAEPCRNGGTCSKGVCQCKQDWDGLTCQDKKCPADCSDHGECDLVSGSCTCSVGWTSGDCSVQEAVSDFRSGKVTEGTWVYFQVTCPSTSLQGGRADTAELTYRMIKSGETPTADPFLFVQVGNARPTTSKFVARDRSAWMSRSSEAVVTLSVRTGSSGGATIGIYNTRQYAKEELQYTGSVSCVLKSDIQPCPSTQNGVCNGHGDCIVDEAKHIKTCKCETKWSGQVCDKEDLDAIGRDAGPGGGNKPKPQLVKEYTLKQGDVQYLTLTLTGSAGKQMNLQIKGLDEWIGISVSSGNKKPAKDDPRNCDYHNYWDKWKFTRTGMSEVIVPKIDAARYTMMFLNPSSDDKTFNLEVTLWSPSNSNFLKLPDDSSVPGLLLVSDDVMNDNDGVAEGTEMDAPKVPLAAIGEDGRLPNPVLSMSSRSSVEGMASSKEMQLLKIEEFCSQSKTGLYVKCSNIDGTATICSDYPAVVFHGVQNNQQPKDVSDFKVRVVTVPGSPTKKWAHLPDWSDSCQHHVRVEMDRQNHFLGVAALQRGQFITFNAVMQGKDTNLFLNDEGALKSGFGMMGMAMLSSLITVFLVSSCYFGYWYRQKRANENARRFTQTLRRSVAIRKESKRLTELSMKKTNSANPHSATGSAAAAAYNEDAGITSTGSGAAAAGSASAAAGAASAWKRAAAAASGEGSQPITAQGDETLTQW